MKLIDADKLKYAINHKIIRTLEDVHRIIDEQPTAYDLDKVVNGLNEMIEDNVDCETGERCDNWVVDMQNELVLKCGEVVKSGVIES